MSSHRKSHTLAPWTTAEVEALNAFQANRRWHPFTCGNRPHPGNAEGVLTATAAGWRCSSCDYTQDWAHAFMADPRWISELFESDALREALGRQVREAWVAWAQRQGNSKPSWLVGWDDLDAGQREVDEEIGLKLFWAGYSRGLQDGRGGCKWIS
jgi:hypothetical protein